MFVFNDNNDVEYIYDKNVKAEEKINIVTKEVLGYVAFIDKKVIDISVDTYDAIKHEGQPAQDDIIKMVHDLLPDDVDKKE